MLENGACHGERGIDERREPALVRKRGDVVLGGSVNTGNAMVLEVTRVGEDTALAAIHRLLERSLTERPEWVESAQGAVPVFVGLILLASIGAGAVWWWIDPARALWVAVSVLIVTCPCALALATPAAVTVATGAILMNVASVADPATPEPCPG